MAVPVKVGKTKPKRKQPQADIPFANSLDHAVIATDLAGKVVFWNSAAETVYGWKWDQAVGRTITELIVPEPEQGNAEAIMEKLRAGKTWTGTFRVRRRDGSEFVTTVTDQPIRDSDGNLIGILGISECDAGAA